MNVSLEGHDPAVNIAVGQDQGRFAAQMEPFFQLSVWSAQHTEGGPGESRGILNNLERGDSLELYTIESSVHDRTSIPLRVLDQSFSCPMNSAPPGRACPQLTFTRYAVVEMRGIRTVQRIGDRRIDIAKTAAQ